MPHREHVVWVSGLALCPPRTRLDLHGLQRFGSFLNCLSWKKSCSPAVNTNSAPQSAQLSTRSANSTTLLLLAGIQHGFPCEGWRRNAQKGYFNRRAAVL